MEIKIGIQNVGREIVLESSQNPDDVSANVDNALSNGQNLKLTDKKGNLTIIPSSVIGYVEIGTAGSHPVGFGMA